MVDLFDKVVIITGASSGIGEGIAVHLASLGAKLTLTGRNEENLQEVSKRCTNAGLDESKILCVTGDIRHADLRESLITKTIDKYGQVDVLVNNSGVMRLKTLNSSTEDDYNYIMDINLKSAVFLTQLAVPHLQKTKGNIVNISSILGSTPVVDLSFYSVSKAALDMYTKCLAMELGPCGVRVNSVNPGVVISKLVRREDSPFIDDQKFNTVMDIHASKIPLGRVLCPEDVAKAVAFVASNERASMLSGSILHLDGGGSRYKFN